MADRVAIITGAGRGIGRATAEELSGRGFACVLVSRTRGELVDTADGLSGEALVVADDVAEAGVAERIAEAAVEAFGRIDALVSAAGVAPMLPIGETDDATLRQVTAVNVEAPFRLARACWPHLAKAGGAVVTIGSQAARDPFTPFAAYAMSKAAVAGLTLALAREGEPDGVRAYAVAPGAVETDMLRGLFTAEQLPAAKTLAPADVAAIVADCVDGPLRHASGETIYLRR